jgi:hypothetical protein
VRNRDRTRLWDLVELLQNELARPCPDWKAVRAAAEELWERMQQAP